MSNEDQAMQLAKDMASELIARQDEFDGPFFVVNKHYPTGFNAIWHGALTALGWGCGLSWVLALIAAIKWVLS